MIKAKDLTDVQGAIIFKVFFDWKKLSVEKILIADVNRYGNSKIFNFETSKLENAELSIRGNTLYMADCEFFTDEIEANKTALEIISKNIDSMLEEKAYLERKINRLQYDKENIVEHDEVK